MTVNLGWGQRKFSLVSPDWPSLPEVLGGGIPGPLDLFTAHECEEEIKCFLAITLWYYARLVSFVRLFLC